MNMKIKLWKQINQADTGGVGKAFQKEKKTNYPYVKVCKRKAYVARKKKKGDLNK